MITQNVVERCQLVATGITQVQGVHGMQDSETFVVDIGLPNGVAFAGVRVTKGQLPDADMLIGMDIISQGDFTVTNFGGITKFSFRVPSLAHIDFVEDIQNQRATAVQPASPPDGKSRAERRNAKFGRG